MQNFDPNQPGPPPTYAAPMPTVQNTGGVRVPILISGILNLIWALVLAIYAPFTMCISLLPAALLLTLGILELVYTSKIGGSPEPWRHKGAAQTLGILSIVEVIFCTPNFICGIITLTNLKKLDP